MTQIIVRTLITIAFAASAMGTTLRPTPTSTPITWQVGTYSYDGSGNIVSIDGMSDTYLYDAVGRLAQATANTAGHANAQTFSYDAFGNLLEVDTSIKIGSAPTSYGVTIMGVDAHTNRLTNAAPCNTIGTPTCVTAGSRGYDAAGNMRGSINGDEYDLDPLHAVIERRGVGGMRQRYLYDANGERVAILSLPPTGSTPTITDFSLRGLTPQVLRTVRVSGTGASATWSWREDYVYRADKLLASVIADGTTAGKREHFHPDHLGTPRLITDDRGYKLSLHTYWPFGQEAPASDVDSEAMKFTGHERDFGFDSERDLDYMHARYYGPVAGRFLSVDPASGDRSRPQSWNRFTYGLNNPVGNTDPDGRCTFTLSNGTPYNDDSPVCDEVTANAPSEAEEAMDIAFDTIDGSFETLFEVSGVGNVMAGIYNNSLRQIAKGVGQQVLLVGPNAAASALTPAAGASANLLADSNMFGSPTAESVANGVRLAQELRLESANSAFSSSGELSEGAINGSSMTHAPGTLGNPAIPTGFGKFTTQTFQSPSGPFQVHYYMNPTTGAIHYLLDYKVVFNVPH